MRVRKPGAGKSTIFNALTAAKSQAANYPFCTIDPNVGVGVDSVLDKRLDRIAEIVQLRARLYQGRLLPLRDLFTYGSEQAVKEKGLYSSEGKERLQRRRQSNV